MKQTAVTKVFFDTEFTGLHQETTLVSIGLVAETGETFYAELTDYDKDQINDWLQENVIDKLLLADYRQNELRISTDSNFTFKGTVENLALSLMQWLEQFPKVEMWSDCLSYDWVLFCQIFGHAFSIPAKVYYIPFDICPLLLEKTGDADINREKFAYGEYLSEMKAQKHNALWDAKVIRDCYYKLQLVEAAGQGVEPEEWKEQFREWLMDYMHRSQTLNFTIVADQAEKHFAHPLQAECRSLVGKIGELTEENNRLETENERLKEQLSKAQDCILDMVEIKSVRIENRTVIVELQTKS